MEKKQVWNMVDFVEKISKVDFGKPVTLNEAIEMWLAEEYLDVLDTDIETILEFREAK